MDYITPSVENGHLEIGAVPNITNEEFISNIFGNSTPYFASFPDVTWSNRNDQPS